MLRVLFVEDNDRFRKLVLEYYSENLPWVSFDEAEDAEQALDKIRKNPPDLVFTDLRLPNMTGLQLIQKIKKDFPDLPTVLLTAYDFPEYEYKALEYGAVRVFCKGSSVLEDIEHFLEKHKKQVPPIPIDDNRQV